MPPVEAIDDVLAAEAEELDGYFSDAPLDPKPIYPELSKRFDKAVVITNLPRVQENRYEKLIKVVTKLVSKIGTLQSTEEFSGVFMPMHEGGTKGFCFVEYETQEDAKKAVEVLQGYKFDKNHELTVTLYERARKLEFIDTSIFREPEPAAFEEKPNAMEWLEDPNQRDEFMVRYNKETVVYWYDAKNDPAVDYDGSREKDAGVAWCEYYCHWSPAGSYLATLVPPKGVILWSGRNYDKVGRFVAPGVRHVILSPQETFLLTNSEQPDDPAAIKIYHIPTGQLLRAFPLYPDGVSRDAPPPPFLWSHDDKYLARMGKGLVSIYETPSMKLLDKRSLAADGIHEFQWSPKANILALWAPEQENSPAHVDIIEIPSREKLRQKNLFNVTNCSMVWHTQGDYLAVKVTRHTKSKKTFYNNIELFRLNEPGIPVEMLDIKDAVMALQFEPKGSRFAIAHAENPSASKVKVSFYDMMKLDETKKAKNKVPELNFIETLQGRQCNFISWSPAGNVIILASLGDSASGTLEFYDVGTKQNIVKEHYRANQLLWDPSGRTVATVVSQPIEGGSFKFSMNNGYILWSFQGKQLYQQSFESFYQFLWRPRISLLSASEINKVRRNLKKYEKQFDREDRRRQRLLYLEETKGKREERAKIRDTLSRNREIRRKLRADYIQLLGGYDSEDESNFRIHDLYVETILTTKEEVISM